MVIVCVDLIASAPIGRTAAVANVLASSCESVFEAVGDGAGVRHEYEILWIHDPVILVLLFGSENQALL